MKIASMRPFASATVLITTVGSFALLLALANAKACGQIIANRIVAMRPSAGFPDSELRKKWYCVPCPNPTVVDPKTRSLRKGKGHFLRYSKSRISRSCVVYYWKKDFFPDGTPKYPPARVSSSEEMVKNLQERPMAAAEDYLYRAHIPCGSHNISRQTVLDILEFVRAGPDDIIADIGSGCGSVVLTSAVALKTTALGLEYLPLVFKTVRDVICSLNSVCMPERVPTERICASSE